MSEFNAAQLSTLRKRHSKWLAGDGILFKGNCLNLWGKDLRSADLRDADLRSAKLHGADLRTANLCGADLSGANLSGTDLSSANLEGANLGGGEQISSED